MLYKLRGSENNMEAHNAMAIWNEEQADNPINPL